MKKKNKFHPSQDEKLFRESVGEVRPIKHNKVSPEPMKTKRTKAPVHHEEWQNELPMLSSTDALEFSQNTFSKKALKQLKSGNFDIDAELDLHGMTIPKAAKAFAYFLRKCLAQDALCVLIIHGKSHGDYNRPILKNELNVWLREDPRILSFCSATPKDGGTGALYVILQGKTA